jgi:hypothetical protein
MSAVYHLEGESFKLPDKANAPHFSGAFYVDELSNYVARVVSSYIAKLKVRT